MTKQKAMEAGMKLLARVLKTWAAVPELSQLEQKGLGLLVAAGLVERRLCLRLRAVGKKRAVEVRFRFSGETGLAQAMEPGLAESWSRWETHLTAGRKVYVEWPEGEGEWRLTDMGEQAEKDRQGSLADVQGLRHFLRRPGVPGADELPPEYRFLLGVRPVVSGEGHVERVEIVNVDSQSLSVHVDNLEKLSGPARDIARAVEVGFQRLVEAKKEMTGQTEANGDEFDELSVGSKLIALYKEHPDWTKATQFAKALGLNRTTIYNYPEWRFIQEFIRKEKATKEHEAEEKLRGGSKDGETGTMESWNRDEMEHHGNE